MQNRLSRTFYISYELRMVRNISIILEISDPDGQMHGNCVLMRKEIAADGKSTGIDVSDL